MFLLIQAILFSIAAHLCIRPGKFIHIYLSLAMKRSFFLPIANSSIIHHPIWRGLLLCCVAILILVSRSRSQNYLTAYEYWIDNNFDNRTIVTISPTTALELNTTIDIENLSLGLHQYHIRFADDSSRFSSVISQIFIAGGDQNLINGFQYWFDDNNSLTTTVDVTPQTHYNFNSTIDASALTRGMHRIHFRYRETGGVWSGITSAFFQKSGEGSSAINLIDGYKYWLDDAYESTSVVSLSAPANPYELITEIDMTAIPQGDHVTHFQFKDLSGLWSSILSDTITKNPFPIALFSTPDPLVCLGENVQFINESFDADSMLWDFGDGTISSAFDPAHLYALPGIYNVSLTATDSTSGLDSTFVATGFVTVLGEVNASFATDIDNGSVTFTNNSTNATNYLWDFGDENTSDEFQPQHTYTADGTYTVTLVASNACGDASVSFDVTIVGVGIRDLSHVGEINIYPNPFHDAMQISIRSEEASGIDIRLYDTHGKEISKIVSQSSVPSEFIYNWSDTSLPAGMYVLKITSLKSEVFYRVVKI
jgi:PKD repeat protein